MWHFISDCHILLGIVINVTKVSTSQLMVEIVTRNHQQNTSIIVCKSFSKHVSLCEVFRLKVCNFHLVFSITDWNSSFVHNVEWGPLSNYLKNYLWWKNSVKNVIYWNNLNSISMQCTTALLCCCEAIWCWEPIFYGSWTVDTIEEITWFFPTFL